jgi:GAF domain-containing protein
MENKKELYKRLAAELKALTEGVPHVISNLANASALIWQNLDDLNWAGFYTLEDNILVLGPFQGKPACIEIPVGRGVCGTAIAQDKTILVPDVHEFPGHIACDEASRSEIVVPLHKDGRLFGVLDIDAPIPNRFDSDDQTGLEALVKILETTL